MACKLCVSESQQVTVLQKSPDSKLAGHFGFIKTLHLVKRQFWLPSQKEDTESYEASCPIYASTKRCQGKTVRFLQSVAESKAPYKEISMDFIIELPESSGNSIICVITDLFSKQVYFVPCQKMSPELTP